MRTPKPNDTSYAVLGLMAIRPWTTYELAGQSERSLRWFFPRAERGVYAEAKRLANWGWAEAERSATGKRPRTVYRITETGRAALDEWMRRASGPTQISSEAALKIFLSDQVPADVRATTIDEVRQSASRALASLAEMAAGHAAGESRFPTRALPNALSMRMIADIHLAIADWSAWAADRVAELEDAPGAAQDASPEETRADGATDEIEGADLAVSIFAGIAADCRAAAEVSSTQ